MPKYPRLESLKAINQAMEQYYIKRKLLARLRPVAYVTSGAPVEILRAMDILPVYPENYGALCGARGSGAAMCQAMEDRGYSQDLCSYAKESIAGALDPKDAPLGGLPKPDLQAAKAPAGSKKTPSKTVTRGKPAEAKPAGSKATSSSWDSAATLRLLRQRLERRAR